MSLPADTVPRRRALGELTVARLPRGWAWVALAGLLLVGAAVLLYDSRGTTFFLDEWNWIFSRRGGGIGTFVRPHNEHLSLVPVIVYKLLFASAGLRDYLPYRVVDIAAHLLCVTLVFVYARRRVGAYLALLTAASILFFGPGAENFLWPFQMAWLFVVAAAVGALLMLDRRDRIGDASACLLLGVALASAGVGLAVAVGLVIEVLARRRPRDLWIVAVPIVLYALWWARYQQGHFVADSALLATRFVFNAGAAVMSSLAGLLSFNPVSQATTFSQWGPALLIASVGALVWRVHALGRVSPRVAALLATTLSFWVITGLGRAFLPVGGIVLTATGDESRYVYVGAVLVVLLAAELARGTDPSLSARVAIGVLAVAAIVSNIGVLRDHALVLRSAAPVTRTALGTLDLTRTIVTPGFPSAGFSFQLARAGDLFAAERDLGSPAAGLAEIERSPDGVRMGADQQLIAVHGAKLESAAPSARPGGPPPAVDAVQSGTVARSRSCVQLRPALFTSGATPMLELTLPPSGLLLSAGGAPATVSLRRFSSQFEPLGTVSSGGRATLRIGPDGAAVAWHVRISTNGAVGSCSL